MAGETYYIVGFEKIYVPQRPQDFSFERVSYGEFKLSWDAVDGASEYNVYVAYESDASYTFVGSTTRNTFNLSVEEGKENVRKTFVVTAVKNGVESKRSICYSNPIELGLELYSVSWVVENGRIIAPVNANDTLKTVRLYSKSADGTKYALVAETLGNVIEYNYDSSKSYAISVTSKFSSEECELIELTLDNNASNIINNKSFDEKGTVDLENIYSLDELFIYLDFTFAGDSLKVERLYFGEWFTVVDLSSNDEVNSKVVDGCLKINFDSQKANKIRISTGSKVDFVNVVLTGSMIDEKAEYENAFSGKEFIPSPDASGNMYSNSYGYQTITDGIIYQEGEGRYSSALRGGLVEATVNFGKVYNLSELKIYLYKDGLSKFGTGFAVQVLFDGEWTTVVDCENASQIEKHLVKNTGGVGDWLIFDLGDVYASKLKFTIPNQTDSGWTTFYEMECFGAPSTKIDPSGGEEPAQAENVLANKQFVPTNEATSNILVASWWKGGGYEALTDGNKTGEATGRFSTVMAASGMMDATLDLGCKYELNTIKFYLYDTKDSITEAKKKGSIGKDLLIQVYSDGQWKDVVVCSDNTKLCEYLVINPGLNNDYLEFDLGGVVAERVRFYISGAASSDGITYQEIECLGIKVK